MKENAAHFELPSIAEQAIWRDRLKRAREVAGQTPENLAKYLYNSTSAYYDLENCNSDLYLAVSLKQLSDICTAIGIRPSHLFFGSSSVESGLSSQDLISKINSHLETNKISISEFEKQVGYDIASSLADSSKISEWNVDCLCQVCKEIGLHWRQALPQLP